MLRLRAALLRVVERPLQLPDPQALRLVLAPQAIELPGGRWRIGGGGVQDVLLLVVVVVVVVVVAIAVPVAVAVKRVHSTALFAVLPSGAHAGQVLLHDLNLRQALLVLRLKRLERRHVHDGLRLVRRERAMQLGEDPLPAFFTGGPP